MKPAKKNRDWPKEDIDGIADEVSDELDELGEDHPCKQSPICILSIRGVPSAGAPIEEDPQKAVTDQGRRR